MSAPPLTSQQFRALSQQVGVSPNAKLGSDRTREDQQACHRAPNFICAEAYNSSPHQPNTQASIAGHAHAPANISYSTHNRDHSARERALQSDQYTATHVQHQAAAMHTSLQRLHQEDPFAASRVMSAAAAAGPGFREAVSSFDMRTYNSPAEKRTINAARKQEN